MAVGRPATALTAAPLLLIALAIANVSTGMAAILVAPAPIFGLALGVVLGERMPWQAVAGAFVGFAGVVIATGGGNAGSVGAVLALLGASAGYAVGARAIRAWFADAAPEAVALAASLPALPLAVILGIVGLPPRSRMPGRCPARGPGRREHGPGPRAVVRARPPRRGRDRAARHLPQPAGRARAGRAVAGEALSAGELIGLVVVFAGIAMTSGAFKLPRLAWTTSTSES